MRFFLIVVCTLFFGLLLSGQSFAASQIYNKDVVQVLNYASYAVVHYEPSQANSEGCTYTHEDKQVIIDWGTDDDMKLMYSSVMAAFMAGKQVSFGVSGCFGNPSSSIPLVYRVEVER